MKKNGKLLRISAVLFILLSVCAFAVSCKNTDAPAEGTESVSDDGIDSIEIVDSVKDLYDDSGALIGRESFYSDGSIKFHEDYNKNGDVVSSVAYNEDGTENATQKITYDENGSAAQYITNKYYYENGNMTEYNTSYFDSRQMLTSSDSYSADGSFQSGARYEYDDRGNIIVEKQLGKDLCILAIYYRAYDEKSNLIEEKTVDSQENFVSLVRYEYNDEGKTVKETNYNEAGDITSYCQYVHKDGAEAPEKHIFVPDGKGGYLEY